MTENQVVENAETLNPEQQQESLRAVAEMRAKVYSQLIDAHIMSLTRVMISSNGTSELEKRRAESALREAVKFALDFGLGATNAEIRQKGTMYAKETNTLAAVLVQALDNRMLLLADNMRQDQEVQELEENSTDKASQSPVEVTPEVENPGAPSDIQI